VKPHKGGFNEFEASLKRRMEKLAEIHADAPDGERRAILARARREMVERSRVRRARP